jgi:hypothetical protein
VVTLWRSVAIIRGTSRPVLFLSRTVHSFALPGAMGLAFDFQDDRPLYQSVQKCHRQRTIRHVLSPFLEVHVGHQCGGSLLVA